MPTKVQPGSSRSLGRGGGKGRSQGTRLADEDLLDAATAVFSECSFHDASMDLIAQRANSTKPTFYAHFGSKDALYGRCLEREVEVMLATLVETYDAAMPLKLGRQVRLDVLAFFELAARRPEGFRLLFGSEETAASTRAREELFDGIVQQTARRIRSYPIPPGRSAPGRSADFVASLVIGAAVAGARHMLLNPDVDQSVFGELASSYIVAGLRHFDLTYAAMLDE